MPEQFRVSGFPGVLRCVRERGQSSLRCLSENDFQFHGSESKGKLKLSGKRRQSSQSCWPETDEQFHGSESQGQLCGRRRRGARTHSSSRCSSSAQGGRFSACATRFFGSAEEGSGLVPSVSHSFAACDSFSLRVESPSSRVQRVNVALHGLDGACDTHSSLNSYSVHGAGGVLNSEKLVGNWAVRGRGVCVPGETKTLSMSGVRRPAVDEFALLIRSRRPKSCMKRRGQAF